jgi:hypothetical protein
MRRRRVVRHVETGGGAPTSNGDCFQTRCQVICTGCSRLTSSAPTRTGRSPRRGERLRGSPGKRIRAVLVHRPPRPAPASTLVPGAHLVPSDHGVALAHALDVPPLLPVSAETPSQTLEPLGPEMRGLLPLSPQDLDLESGVERIDKGEFASEQSEEDDAQCPDVLCQGRAAGRRAKQLGRGVR